MEREEKILFSIKGPGVDDSFRLDEFADIISSYQNILDRSFLAVTGKRRMGKAEREQFSASIQDWRHGSIVIDLAVVALPFIQGYVDLKTNLPHFLTISEVVESTYKFLKARIEQFLKTGREPTVKIINSPNSQVFLNVGEGNIEVSQNLVDAANFTEPHYKRLTSHIDGERITEVGSWSSQENGLTLTAQDNEVFNPSTIMDEETQEIEAKIFRFDVESTTGRLRVLDAKDIEGGKELRFQLVGGQPLDKYVDAMHSSIISSKLTILREVIQHPSGTISVSGLHVVKLH